jgi:flagellar hook-associated protein 2
MATLSSPGIGSGLDINGIVSQMMALERRPLELLQRSTSRYEAQLSAFGRIQSAIGSLRDAAATLATADTWRTTGVSSSDAAAVAATSSGAALPGRYSVAVSALASAQTVATASSLESPDAVVGSGTLTIELGRWSDGGDSFTPKAGATAVTIAVAPGSDTLVALRDAINAANAGVVASIVNDASGARLVLRSGATGAENGFRIAVADDDGDAGDAAGLSRLAYDPSTAASQMTRTQAAGNAEASINGVAVSSATNTLTDVVDGLTLRLARTTAAPVEIEISRDDAAIKKSVTGFVATYNELVKLLRSQTAYDEASKQAGVLQGDRGANALASSLRSLIGGSSGAGGPFARLADVGLEPQRDGTLKVVDGKLDAAIGRAGELESFFGRDAEGQALDGFAVLLRSFADGVAGSGGMLASRTEGVQQRIQRANDSAARLEDRLALVEQRLRATYTRLDTNMASLTGLQDYVSQQIQNWNRSGS